MPFKLQWSICLTFPAHISVASEIIAKWWRFSLKHDELELFNLLRLLDKELENWFNHTNPRIVTTKIRFFWFFSTISTHIWRIELLERRDSTAPVRPDLQNSCLPAGRCSRVVGLGTQRGQKLPGNCLKRSNRRCSGIPPANNFKRVRNCFGNSFFFSFFFFGWRWF